MPLLEEFLPRIRNSPLRMNHNMNIKDKTRIPMDAGRFKANHTTAAFNAAALLETLSPPLHPQELSSLSFHGGVSLILHGTSAMIFTARSATIFHETAVLRIVFSIYRYNILLTILTKLYYTLLNCVKSIPKCALYLHVYIMTIL